MISNNLHQGSFTYLPRFRSGLISPALSLLQTPYTLQLPICLTKSSIPWHLEQSQPLFLGLTVSPLQRPVVE